MHPEQQEAPLRHAPHPAPTQGSLNPIAQFECWAMPDGGHSIFAFKKYTAVVYQGLLVLYRPDHTEAVRVPLGSDLKVKYSFGFARIAYTNGQKFSIFNKRYGFVFGPMWPYAFLVFSALTDLIIRVAFFQQAPNSLEPEYWWRLTGSIMILVALIIMVAVNIPQAQAFKVACYRAAGVAS